MTLGIEGGIEKSGNARSVQSHLEPSAGSRTAGRLSEVVSSTQMGAAMNTKLVLQVLLTLGCLALATGTVQTLAGRAWLTSSAGWWRGAMACWMLIVAIRVVYSAHTK
jgi:hypothetical protein